MITMLGANWQLFRLERIAKCSYFILSTQNIKFYWFVMNIKKFLLPIWWYNRGSFPLGNKYFLGLRSEWVSKAWAMCSLCLEAMCRHWGETCGKCNGIYWSMSTLSGKIGPFHLAGWWRYELWIQRIGKHWKKYRLTGENFNLLRQRY